MPNNWWETESNLNPEATAWQRSVARWQQQLSSLPHVQTQQQPQTQAGAHVPSFGLFSQPQQQPQQQAQGWAPPGWEDLWRDRLQRPAPTPRVPVIQPAEPAKPSTYAPPLLPPGAPEYETELIDYRAKGEELARQIFPESFFSPTENLPEWMQKPEEFIRRATVEGLGRLARAWEKPEERALLGGRPGEELFQVPGEEGISAVSPEDLRVWTEPGYATEAIREKEEQLPQWLQVNDPLHIGHALASMQVYLPAAAKWWERLTERSSAARVVEQVGAVGLAALQEPAIGLEELTGAAAVMARPESRNLTVEDWYPLTTKTWSLTWDQAKYRLGETFRYNPDPANADVLGYSLASIADGTATAEQIALAREQLGAELIGQVAADPLNLLDWMLAANKAARGKAVTAAQAKLLESAADSPDAARALGLLERGMVEAGLIDADAIRFAAEATGAPLDPTTWDRIKDIATKPFQFTPEAKTVRDLEDMTVVLAPAVRLSKSGDEAIQLLRMWADDPASLAPMFGRVPESLAGQKTSAILRGIVDQLAELPSVKAADWNAARFWVDLDQVAHQALRLTHGYEAPGKIERFFLAYKRLMSEVYLNAIFSPGYVIRNTLGDGAAMATDGLLTFEHVDNIDDFLAQFGPGTRRMMTEGAAGREALTGEGAIRSMFPGPLGGISEKGQEITRFAEPLGRLPLGEESRYKRAIYSALKRFWNENAPGMLPALPPVVRRAIGDDAAEHLLGKLAYEPNLAKRRQALTDFLDGTKGQQLEPTRYLDADDLDAMSPVVLNKIRQDLAKLDTESTVDDVREVINKAREAVEEAEQARLAEMEDLPAAIHVTTNVDEAEIADEVVDELAEIVARTGDKDLAREVEEVKKAIPEIERQLDTARADLVDDLLTEPTPDGMEIILRANAEVEDLRHDWRQALNRLRQETKAAYDALPPGASADELWSTYFRTIDEQWSELANRRIARFADAQDQLRRFRGGESLDDILGQSRRAAAEERLLKASQVPDRPQGFLPGKVLRSGEDEKFEQFLAWHRGTLDNTRTNAWRAVYGAEPEDYGKVLDLLDSADRDIEQFGKATAGKVRKLYEQAEKEARKALAKHKSGKMGRLAVDAVWEKYYILRNDAWNRYWQAAAERWKIAERDVLWGNWARGPRMEPPAPVPTPRPPQAPPAPEAAQAAIPEAELMAADEGIVKAAILKPDSQWSDVERKAIQRWTKAGQELPEVQPSIFPAEMDIPPFTRDQFVEGLKAVPGYSDQLVDDIVKLMDEYAQVWGNWTGRNPEEFFGLAGGGYRQGEGGTFELYQRAENLDTPEFGAWFSDAADVAKEAEGGPKMYYHGSPGSGFEWFDVGRADPYNLFGPGIYMTEAQDVASGYAGTAGVVQFADTPENLLPRIREAAIKAEHPQVTTAREDMLRWNDAWEEYVGQRGPGYRYSLKDRREIGRLEDGYEQARLHFEEVQKRYGSSGAEINWETYIQEGAEAVDRQLANFGIDPSGIIHQTGGPGVYPVYTNVKNPFDINTTYDVADYTRIFGAEPSPLTVAAKGGTFSGEDIYQYLQGASIDALKNPQGLPAKAWANQRLQELGYDGITHIGGVYGQGWKEHQVIIAFDGQNVKSVFNKGDWGANRQLLYQGAGLGAKGAVDFLEDGRTLISFFENADASTAGHELFHVFLKYAPPHERAIIEMQFGLATGDFERLYPMAVEHQWLSNLPKRTAAQEERMGKLASAAKKYEAAHEHWARAGERYLAEGIAPSPELEGVFQRFKEWLIAIYRKIAGSSIDVELNDKMRGVMDRLLAENPVPRPDDPFGTELFDARLSKRREEVANVISAARSRHPLDLEDASRLYQQSDPQNLARTLEQRAQEYAELSTRDGIESIARRRTHAAGEERWQDMSWRANKPRAMEELPVWEQGEYTRTVRTQSASAEKDLYWQLQGISPGATAAEKRAASQAFMEEQAALADWYYTLAMQAQDTAAGRPVTSALRVPESVAVDSLDRLEALEALRGREDLDDILRELGYKRSDIFPGEAPERPMPEWAEEFEGAPGGRLYQKERPERIDPSLARQAMAKAKQRTHVWTEYIMAHYRATGDLAPGADAKDLFAWLEANMPDELGAITAKAAPAKARAFRPTPGRQYQTPEGIGTAVSVESGRGAKNAWIELPDGTKKQFAFDQLSVPEEAAPAAAAPYEQPPYIQEAIRRREAGEAPKAAPPQFGQVPTKPGAAQMGMFEAGEELPLFSGTAQRAEGARFAPPQAAAETMLPGFEPAMGDLEKYAARPVEAAPAAAVAEAPEWLRAKERYNQLFGLPPEQIKYFDELTPAQVEEVRRKFSAELVNVDNYVYAVKKDGGLVARRETRRPMWEPKTPRPTKAPEQLALGGEEATRMEALRPKRKPKGQMTLWQEPEQLGFWRMDPDQWRQYIEAINQPGATPGPLPAEILQRSTDATRRSLDKIEQGMTRDWDDWQGVFADQSARAGLEDWFNNSVTPSWYESRAVAYDYARAQADFSILDYSRRRNLDSWMAYIFPYHYWFTRAGKNWAQRLAKRPGMLANYVRTRDAMKLANQNAGRRQRFEGMVGVPFPWLPDWMGDKVYVDPIGLISPYSQIFGTDWDDSDDAKRGLRGVYGTAQRFGLRPYHIWDYLYNMGAFAKAGEMMGMAPGPAQQMLGPEYTQNVPYVLPQTGVIKGITALARQAGAEGMPPGGVNIEAPIRRLVGLPAGEIWDPYRINRMLANLSAEDSQNMELAQAALRAQELVAQDETQTGKVWDPTSELAQQIAQEQGWSSEQLQQAQELLATAMQRATMERSVGTLGWAAGPRMAIEPTGERAQLEMVEQARAQTWSPQQPGGSREGYEQFKATHPAMYPRATQYNTLPGEQEYEAMPPGARANWLILRGQKEMLHDEYDQAVDNLLRQEPWNWSGRGELEDQRRAALAQLDAMYPMPEMEGEMPAILYGMNPPEMWNSTVEKELYQMQATKPDPGAFETDEGVDWDAYYREEEKWRAQLPKSFSFGVVMDGMYQKMDPATAMRNFEQRYDSPLEAAYKLYQQDIASPAWDDYNKAKREEERLWPGMRDLQDQYWDLPQNQRGAFVRQHPNLPDYWDWKDQHGSAYARTVGKVGAVPATTLIPSILARYATKGWTEEQLRQELEGVIFPSLSDQQDLKKGRTTTPSTQAAAATGGAYAGGGGYGATRAYSQYNPKLQSQVQNILRYWNARQGRYSWMKGGGYGGGGYRYRQGSEYQYPRWRPKDFQKGGPFTGGTAGMIWGGPYRG